MSKIAFKIAYALMCLSDEFAEYGPIIDKVRLVQDDREDTTMWVNPHLEMGFGEKWCKKLKSSELKAVVLHELRHIEYGHFVREESIRRVYGKGYTHYAHNVAMDLEINSKIPGLPECGHFPKNYDYPENLTYEEYFQKIIRDPKFKDRYTYLISSGGKMNANDLDLEHIRNSGKVRNDSSSNDTLSIEDENFLNDLEKEVTEAKESRGSGKGGSTGKLKIKPSQPIDILNYVRTRCATVKNEKTFGYDMVDYNSFKITAISDVIDFKTFNEVVPITLSFVIDVSGSRTDKQINESISKIWSTLESVDDITFIIDIFFADDGVTQINHVLRREDIPKTFKGRGGTWLSKAYEEFKIEYDLIVIMTDGFCDYSDINNLEKKFYNKTIVGIDKESYLTTHMHFMLPTFVL